MQSTRIHPPNPPNTAAVRVKVGLKFYGGSADSLLFNATSVALISPSNTTLQHKSGKRRANRWRKRLQPIQKRARNRPPIATGKTASVGLSWVSTRATLTRPSGHVRPRAALKAVPGRPSARRKPNLDQPSPTLHTPRSRRAHRPVAWRAWPVEPRLVGGCEPEASAARSWTGCRLVRQAMSHDDASCVTGTSGAAVADRSWCRRP